MRLLNICDPKGCNQAHGTTLYFWEFLLPGSTCSTGCTQRALCSPSRTAQRLLTYPTIAPPLLLSNHFGARGTLVRRRVSAVEVASPIASTGTLCLSLWKGLNSSGRWNACCFPRLDGFKLSAEMSPVTPTTQ